MADLLSPEGYQEHVPLDDLTLQDTQDSESALSPQTKSTIGADGAAALTAANP